MTGAAQQAWHYAVENMRGDRHKVIVEEFIAFDYEITLLTVRQKAVRLCLPGAAASAN